jgi:hypothetical protein
LRRSRGPLQFRAMFDLRTAAAALILACSLTGAAEAAEPTWVPSGMTTYTHQDAAAVALPGGESALLISGLHWTGSGFDEQTVERYDLASNRWTPVARVPEPHRGAGAVALRDGRVFVAGGWHYPEGDIAAAALYSPATDSWAPAEPMNAGRSPRLVLLDSGKVLAVAGSWTAGLSEVYDPATGHWSSIPGGGPSRLRPGVAKLRDGRVLVAGGDGLSEEYASAELYDPATDTWTPVAPMHEVRRNPLAATLPDGRVLVAGGYRFASPESTAASGTYEIYNPADNTWTTPAKLSRPRANDARMVTLSDGRLVITGGYNALQIGALGGEQSTADIYDPRTGTWTETAPAFDHRAQHVAVALRDDSVLLAGGAFDTRRSERLVFPVPDPPQNPVRTPEADATPTPTPGSVPPPVSNPRPKAVLSAASRLRAKRGVVTVKVRCAGPGVCVERLTLRVRRGRTLARADVSVAAGKSRTVRLKLSSADRRRLAKRSTKVVLTLGSTTRNATLRV